MKVAPEYQGEWTGIVTDSGRSASYRCTITLGTADGTSRYDQVSGLADGEFTVISEAPLVLHEDYTGPRGGKREWTLALALNALGELECVWDGGICRGTLERAS